MRTSLAKSLPASLALLLVAGTATAATPTVVDYTVQLDVIRSGYDGVHCWVHPRAGIVPQPGRPPAVVMTLQNLWLKGSDVFGPLNDLRTDDLGLTWSPLTEHAATLGQRPEADGATVGVCDFWPKWHAASGKLLGLGHSVRYRNNAVLHERPRETVFSIYDAAARTWSAWRPVAMPAEPRFYNAGAGSAQRVDLPDGSLLVPFYFKAKGRNRLPHGRHALQLRRHRGHRSRNRRRTRSVRRTRPLRAVARPARRPVLPLHAQ